MSERPDTLIGLILFIACGMLVVIVTAVMIKRQIMRFTLKSKSEQHITICSDVPKKMRLEAKRRLNRTADIGHEPNLLHNESKKHSPSSTEYDSIPHLYRMKALDACKDLETKLTKDKSQCRTTSEAFDIFLRNHVHSLPVRLQQSRLDEFYSLYRHARHEPKPFGKTSYDRMVGLISEMCDSIQGAKRRTVQSTAIRPIADIDEIPDEVLPSVSRTPSTQFKLPIRQAVMEFAGKVFKKSKNKQEYQTVPSTESIDDINETTQL